jgi:HEPN domain-containing protein
VPRECCWLAQQAAEKALKAALVFLGIDFPRTHNLADLRRLLPSASSQQRNERDLAQLSRWGVEARYPGDWPEPSQDDARTAIAQAQSILADVVSDLAAHGFLEEDRP